MLEAWQTIVCDTILRRFKNSQKRSLGTAFMMQNGGGPLHLCLFFLSPPLGSSAFMYLIKLPLLEKKYHSRLDVAWGGFNVVQATLNAVALALEKELPFNWLWILSGTTYPIASNDDIRARLASHHPEAVSISTLH